MTEKQRKDLLAAVQGIARALGAEVEPDKDPKEQYARGLAFILGRLLGKPPLVRAVAGWAVAYIPEEPTAAPAGNDTDPHADLRDRMKAWPGERVRLHVMTTDPDPTPADVPPPQGPKPGDPF